MKSKIPHIKKKKREIVISGQVYGVGCPTAKFQTQLICCLVLVFRVMSSRSFQSNAVFLSTTKCALY